MNLKRIALLSFALLTSFCLAETKVDYVLFNPDDLPKKQYAFTYKLEKNEQIIAEHPHVFSINNPSLVEGWSGSRTEMYYYKCRNGEKETIPSRKTVLINNYPISQCNAEDNGDATCTVRLYNAKDQNALAFEEFNKKSCKKVEPIISVQEFTLNLNATDKNGVKDFGDGYKLHFVYREFQ